MVTVGLLAIVIGGSFIVYGLTQFRSCEGLALVLIGLGMLIAGIGGKAVIKTPFMYVAGGAGVVVLLVGAVFQFMKPC